MTNAAPIGAMICALAIPPRHHRTADSSSRKPPTASPNDRSLKSGRCFFIAC
jgi:hypothetical protein